MDRSGGSEELWRLTVEHSPVGMALVGLDGTLQAVNRPFCDMLGRTADELCGKSTSDITHPDDIQPGQGMAERAAAGEIDDFRVLKRYRHADGRVVWGDLSAALVRDDDGTPLHLIAHVLDVTEQHEYAERLAASNAELERERRTLGAIFDTVDIGLLLIDNEGTYERMNRQHAETLGLPFPDGHRGKAGQLGHVYAADGRTLLGREDMPSYRATQGEEFDNLVLWVGADPMARAAFSVSARCVRDAQGRMTGAALAYKEITQVMRALQAKDEFVASVSHELRTPLTSVLGHLELLGDRDDLPDDVAGQLRVVERNATRLQTLVSDLLQVAQGRTGGVQLRREEVDLAGLVRDQVEAATPQAATAGIEIGHDVPERVAVEVDGQRIRQVVDNLVSNALKFTDAGGSVGVTLTSEGNSVCLAVSDTGAGMTEAEAGQVFARFFRGDHALRHHIPGTGLGLHIVSTIVAAHGGDVGVESTPGEGSTFRVTLPRVVVPGS